MSKITFRADDDLVEELEALEASKSEAMREALRAYLADEGTATASGQSGRDADRPSDSGGETAIDDIVRKHVDDLLTERLGELERERERRTRTHANAPQDVNVSISLEEAGARRVDASDRRVRTRRGDDRARATDVDGDPVGHGQGHGRGHARDSEPGLETDRGHDADRDRTAERACGQCGEHVDDEHVYCPNCGEKVSRRLFCECGDELRSDWAFCPSCGRRTASADVLESNSR